ncbi:MAG: putative protein kinase/phosphatase [Frankiales bacterium]|nr:putative protein kinase/phosphatase [Frankiales bacterium]
MAVRGDTLSTFLTPAVLDQLAAAVVVVDGTWALQFVSGPAALMLGRSAGSLVGLSVWELFPAGSVEAEPQAAARRAMTDRVTTRLEWFAPQLDLWLSILLVPSGTGLLLLIDDISEQRASERRAERLVELGEALAEARDAEAVNDIVTALAMPLIGASGATILVADDERGVLLAVGWHGLDGAEVEREVSLGKPSAAADAYSTGQAVLLSSQEELAAVYPESIDAMLRFGQAGVATLPLVSAGEPLGVLAMTFAQPRVLSGADLQFLSTTAAMAAQALVRARLIDVETRSIDALQRSLLPRGLPPVQGMETAVRYVASDRTAQIGGDWYDLVLLPGPSVGLVMGDVEGHDLSAAALMGLVRSAVRAYALDGHPPAIVVARANVFLASLELGRIVTLSYAQLHPVERLVIAVSAGHSPTMIVTPDGEVSEVPSEIGPPLGVYDDGQRWQECTSTLPDGCALALFTDGLFETRNESLDAGLDRIAAVLREHAGSSAAEIADALLAVRGVGHDDVALLTARLTTSGSAPRRLARRMPPTPASVPLSRAFARQLLQAWEVPDELAERAELIVSELVTNAARHSEDALEVALEHRGGCVRLEVGETSHRMPLDLPTHVAHDATSGRGLLLVDAVASRWGVESEGLSKLVWAELDLPGPAQSTA